VGLPGHYFLGLPRDLPPPPFRESGLPGGPTGPFSSCSHFLLPKFGKKNLDSSAKRKPWDPSQPRDFFPIYLAIWGGVVAGGGRGPSCSGVAALPPRRTNKKTRAQGFRRWGPGRGLLRKGCHRSPGVFFWLLSDPKPRAWEPARHLRGFETTVFNLGGRRPGGRGGALAGAGLAVAKPGRPEGRGRK